MKFPLYIMEYIVIHELFHIKHKNHSKKVLGISRKVLPNYKEIEKIFKTLYNLDITLISEFFIISLYFQIFKYFSSFAPIFKNSNTFFYIFLSIFSLFFFD